jgi:hypothetical protein
MNRATTVTASINVDSRAVFQLKTSFVSLVSFVVNIGRLLTIQIDRMQIGVIVTTISFRRKL